MTEACLLSAMIDRQRRWSLLSEKERRCLMAWLEESRSGVPGDTIYPDEFADLLLTIIGDLVGALIYFGLNALLGVDDQGLRRLAQLGGPFPRSQQEHLLASCTEEADALRQLLQKMLPGIDVPRAIWRGRFMAALSRVERTGIPVDETALQTLQDRWDEIKRSLVKEADPDSAFFAGTRFRPDRWLRYVESRGMKWPRHKSGQLVLDDVAFRRAAETYPEVRPVREVRRLLSQFHHLELPVGLDGRTRYASGAFGSITGRCQPRAESCILMWPRWTRGLIRPPPGRGLAWLDFVQQEWLVAAALSRDEAMLRDYSEGDCYLALGQGLGLISPGADVGQYPERELCKTIALAALYGQQAAGLARRVNRPITVAADWLRRHRERYRQFWRWSDATVDFARCHGRLWTRFGWQVHVSPNMRETTLRNWRVQATAGEILRLALCLTLQRGFSR